MLNWPRTGLYAVPVYFVRPVCGWAKWPVRETEPTTGCNRVTTGIGAPVRASRATERAVSPRRGPDLPTGS